jgi:hypothetical protein
MQTGLLSTPATGGVTRAQTPSFTVSTAAGLLCTVSSYGLLAPVVFSQTGSWGTYSINASTGAISDSATTIAGNVQTLGFKVTGADGVVIPGTATLNTAAAVPVAPSAVTLGSVTVGNGTLSWPWTDGSNGGSAITNRYYSIGTTPGGEGALTTATLTGTAPNFTLTLTGLTNGQAYYVEAYTRNAIGYSPASNEVSGTPASTATASFTMVQIPTADTNRIFQRSTTTGGGQGKGQGAITLTLSSATAGTVNARIRSSDGSTILQAAWTAATIANGATSVSIPGIDARLGWFYVDLCGSNGTWQNGTVLVGMGALTAFSGQSLMERMFGHQFISDTVTYASSGLTISPYAMSCASWAPDTNYNNYNPTVSTMPWLAPGDYSLNSGPDSLGVGQYLNQMIGLLGVNCGAIGWSHGGVGIVNWCGTNADWVSFAAVIARCGGAFEGMVWGQGHSDSVYGCPSAAYASALSILFSQISAINSFSGYNKYVWTIPAISAAYWGTPYEYNAIRSAARGWCSSNGAVYVDMYDISQYDNVHEYQVGAQSMANEMYRATRANYGASNGIGPQITGATRSGQVITATVSNLGQTGLNLVGSPQNRIFVFPTGSVNSLEATPGTPDPSNRYLISSVTSPNATTLTITLSSSVGTGDVLDMYLYWPSDPSPSTADNIYDNRTDSDGITQGRILQANSTPITIAAPTPGGTHVAPPGGLLAPVSPFTFSNNSSPVFSASVLAGFGQYLSGGYIRGQGPVFTPITHECFLVCPPSNGTMVFLGGNGLDWIGVNGLNLTCDVGLNGATTLIPGDVYHVAYVKGPTGARLYLTNMTAATAGVCDAFTTTSQLTYPQQSDWDARTLSGNFSLVGGGVFEMVKWYGERYTGTSGTLNYAAPSAPYVGTESGLLQLAHLNNSLTIIGGA